MSDYSRGYVEPSRLAGNPFAEEDPDYYPSAAKATMALAYEQRTANLLALWANPTASMTNPFTRSEVTWGVDEEQVGKLLQEILERLGVDK